VIEREEPPVGLRLLRDEELRNLVPDGNQEQRSRDGLLIRGRNPETVPYTDYDSSVQPCSLDLHIGELFEPPPAGLDANKALTAETSAGTLIPKERYALKPGKTVFVRTEEKLIVPDDIAIIGFPPTSLSTKGILTTNPGHVDPGYQGKMHLTMINMGRDEFLLAQGDIVITLLVFRLGEPVAAGYSARRELKKGTREDGGGRSATSAAENPSRRLSLGLSGLLHLWRKPKGGLALEDEQRYLVEVLSTLAPDFLQIEERAKRVADEAAKERVWQSTERIATVGLIGSLIITVLLAGFGYLLSNNLSEVEADYAGLRESNAALEQRVDTLEEQLSSAQQTQGATRQSSVTEVP
jgi:deoxycytidine triphosphate deaminase